MNSFFTYLPTKPVTRIWHAQLIAAFMIFWATAVVFIMPKASLGQTDWTRFESNPVLDVGADGAWDDGGVWHHTVLFHNDEYHLWYTNSNATAIGYARSSDKINWTKDASNPVLEPGAEGSWNESNVIQPVVLVHNDTLRMWFIGANSSSDGIGYATSVDGISWTEFAGNPVLTNGQAGSWDEARIAPMTVIYDGQLFRMWYMARREFSAGGTWRIGLATSIDGTVWTKYDDPGTTDPPFAASDPVLQPGIAGSWDAGSVGNHWVLFNDSIYHLWYEGFDEDFNVRVGYAKSQEGMNWTKYDDPNTTDPLFAESDPVLLPGPSGSWDDADASQSKILFDGTTFHMWYIGRGGSSDDKWRIGYATAPLDTLTTVLYKRAHSAARGFSLEQNYPNPFNPYTTIQYSLAKPEHVSIKIYNLAGQDITTLVDKKQLAGHHEVIWQPADLASGIYIYRMQIQEYVESRKMILLK